MLLPLLCAALFCVTSVSSNAKTLTEKYEKLAGVPEFELDIVPLDAVAKSVGLSEKILRFVAEANLKKAVLPLREKSARPVPYLLVDVRVVCAKDVACGFTLALRFDDVVELRGNTTYAQTWAWNLVGVAEEDETAAAVLGALRDRGMPNFVRDYLAANP